MKLNLTKPLVIFDLETTGLDMVKDRVIQLSYISSCHILRFTQTDARKEVTN